MCCCSPLRQTNKQVPEVCTVWYIGLGTQNTLKLPFFRHPDCNNRAFYSETTLQSTSLQWEPHYKAIFVMICHVITTAVLTHIMVYKVSLVNTVYIVGLQRLHTYKCNQFYWSVTMNILTSLFLSKMFKQLVSVAGIKRGQTAPLYGELFLSS